MSLIKCSECGQEISTEAEVCPHCGKPNLPIEIEHKREMSGYKKATIIIIVGTLLAFGLFIQYRSLNDSGSGTFLGNLSQKIFNTNYKQVLDEIIAEEFQTQESSSNSRAKTSADKSKAVSLQQVDNLGYTFSIGQIDDANMINDSLKTEITKIVYNAHFPKSLLKDIPIVLVNSLALKDGLYIPSPKGNLMVNNFGPSFLYEGGIFASYSTGGKVIFINKETLDKGRLTDVLTHEFGHAIGATLTDADWKTYYSLRNIPAETPLDGGLWNLSPEEDFAEVYKNTFTGLGVRTYYGQLISSFGGEMFSSPCYEIYQGVYNKFLESSRPEVDNNKPTSLLDAVLSPSKIDYSAIEAKVNADPKIQNCRREALINPPQSSDKSELFRYEMYRYESTVGPKTKEFINTIIDRIK